jgi:hypothetical protein
LLVDSVQLREIHPVATHAKIHRISVSEEKIALLEIKFPRPGE